MAVAAVLIWCFIIISIKLTRSEPKYEPSIVEMPPKLKLVKDLEGSQFRRYKEFRIQDYVIILSSPYEPKLKGRLGIVVNVLSGGDLIMVGRIHTRPYMSPKTRVFKKEQLELLVL